MGDDGEIPSFRIYLYESPEAFPLIEFNEIVLFESVFPHLQFRIFSLKSSAFIFISVLLFSLLYNFFSAAKHTKPRMTSFFIDMEHQLFSHLFCLAD